MLVSPNSRSDNDGDCPHCHAELDEDDWPNCPPNAGVPEGWKLVPVEPTPEMQAAGGAAIRFNTTEINKLWSSNAAYRAMVASAPQPPKQEGSGDE